MWIVWFDSGLFFVSDGFWGLSEARVFIVCFTFDTEGLGLGLGIYWKLEASTSFGLVGVMGML